MIEVRPRRLRLIVIAVVAFAAAVAIGYSTPFPLGHLNILLQSMLIATAVMCGGYAMSKNYLSFDPRTGVIRGPGVWQWSTDYPRRGFDRIEYSVYDARIHEVALSGKRRRIPVSWRFADRRDWEAFVDQLLVGRASETEVRGE